MTQSAPTTKRVQDARTVAETLERMKSKLQGLVPDDELPGKAELAFEINQLKREHNIVILGHNYMAPDVFHSICDYVGDSLQLARVSAETKADTIVFCGVLFMAETAKELNPGRKVLLPSLEAGCSLAEGITPEDVQLLRKVYPNAPVITYVNTSAAVKAESDCCCTSGNAQKVVQHYLEQGYEHIIFLPDRFLAHNTANALDISLLMPPEDLEDSPQNVGVEPGTPAIIGWRARCEVHELFTPAHANEVREDTEGVVILAHPECPPEVIALVDIPGSTKVMGDYVRDQDAQAYYMLTDVAMAQNLAVEYPQKNIVIRHNERCPHMELITLDNTLESILNNKYAIELDPKIIDRARAPIDKMLEIR